MSLSRCAAILSSLFLLTAGDILFFASTNSGEIDLFYTLIVYLHIVSIFVFYERRRYLTMFLVSYLLTSLGCLTKGMPSLAFQMLTLTAFLLLQRRPRLLFSFRHLVGLTLCRVTSLKGNVIEVESIDAFDGTPVLDIKPFIPGHDSASDATIPEWLKRASERRRSRRGDD